MYYTYDPCFHTLPNEFTYRLTLVILFAGLTLRVAIVQSQILSNLEEFPLQLVDYGYEEPPWKCKKLTTKHTSVLWTEHSISFFIKAIVIQYSYQRVDTVRLRVVKIFLVKFQLYHLHKPVLRVIYINVMYQCRPFSWLNPHKSLLINPYG